MIIDLLIIVLLVSIIIMDRYNRKHSAKKLKSDWHRLGDIVVDLSVIFRYRIEETDGIWKIYAVVNESPYSEIMVADYTHKYDVNNWLEAMIEERSL